MMSLLESAFNLPLQAMQAAMGLMAKGWQTVAKGMDGMASWKAHRLPVAPEACGDPESAETKQHSDPPAGQKRVGWEAEPLWNGCLKLVEYQVLFVKRGLETAFPQRQELVWDCLTSEQFRIWKIAEFVQSFSPADLPGKWRRKDYPPRPSGGEAFRLPAEDGKYLRVWFQVVQCYPREPFCFEERQVEALRQIRDSIWASGLPELPKPALAAAAVQGDASLSAAPKEAALRLPAASGKNKKGGKKAAASKTKKTPRPRRKAKPKK